MTNIKSKTPVNLSEFNALLEVVATLRGPEGCLWDQEQTHLSLAPYLVEECYELTEAIEKYHEHPQSPSLTQEFKEELGDVLFQVALHSQLAEEKKLFSLQDVIQTLNEKLVRRHPHVFNRNENSDKISSDSVVKKWEEIKKSEKSNSSSSPIQVSQALPSLYRAFKIGKKTQTLTFDWNSPAEVMEKVDEELKELKAELNKENNKEKIGEELGDLFFSLAQLARHLSLEPEQVLRKANRKFENRFECMWKLFTSTHPETDFSTLSLQEKEDLWKMAKKKTSLNIEH